MAFFGGSIRRAFGFGFSTNIRSISCRDVTEHAEGCEIDHGQKKMPIGTGAYQTSLTIVYTLCYLLITKFIYKHISHVYTLKVRVVYHLIPFSFPLYPITEALRETK